MSAVAHRPAGMPVLMRLLDGKMHIQGNRWGSSRRQAIFGFVAGCSSDELELFLGTIFWSVDHLIDPTDIRKTCDNIVETYDPQKTIALRRISSTLDSLNEVFRKLVQSMSVNQNTYVYQITIACHLLIRLGLENASMTPHFRKILRILRKEAFDLSTIMFNSFQNREFSTPEIEVFFERIVEPHLLQPYSSAGTDLKTFDGPWAIMRFFCSLTQLLFFYPLLNIPLSSAVDSRTPLSFLCITLFCSGTNRKTQTTIVESFLNLLTFANEKKSAKLPPIRQETLRLEDGRPFGTRVVVNHVPSLLRHLQIVIPNEIRSSSRSVSLDLQLLDKLSDFADDSILGSEFASTLLTFVERGQLRNEEHLAAVINSVSHFLKHEARPSDYFVRVILLLSGLRSQNTRTALTPLLERVRGNANFRHDLVVHVERLEALESWDKQRINEPDYERRHATLAELSRIFESPTTTIPLEALWAFCHSNFYALTHADEISIRSSASNCIAQLIAYIDRRAECSDDQKIELVCLDFVPLVLRTLRSGNENVRHEAVNTLAALIDHFGERVELLRPLQQLRSLEEQNYDFFENVVHLQLHRRQRAFNRLLLRQQSEEIQIPLEVLEKFVVPLLRPYLLKNEDKFTALSDEAIQLLAEITQHQPWPVYHRTLIFYMNSVRKAEGCVRPIIRVLIAILNVFHSDLTALTSPQSAFGVRRH